VLYIILGIAAAGVLYFFFENEVKQNFKKKALAPKVPKAPKEKPERVDDDTLEVKHKKPDKSKLSFNENERPVMLGKAKPTIQTVQFEEPPVIKKSEFASAPERTKNAIYDDKRISAKKRETDFFERGQDNAYDPFEQEFEPSDDISFEQQRFMRDLGRDNTEQSFPELFHSLPSMVKIMLIDNTIGKAKQ